MCSPGERYAGTRAIGRAARSSRNRSHHGPRSDRGLRLRASGRIDDGSRIALVPRACDEWRHQPGARRGARPTTASAQAGPRRLCGGSSWSRGRRRSRCGGHAPKRLTARAARPPAARRPCPEPPDGRREAPPRRSAPDTCAAHAPSRLTSGEAPAAALGPGPRAAHAPSRLTSGEAPRRGARPQALAPPMP